MARINQNKDPIRWLLKHNGQGPSAATAATIKGEPDDGMTVGQSLGPGGRQLRTVDKGSDALFGDDDDEGGARKRKDNGAEGSYDEMLFAEDFQDDEEKMNVEEEEDDLTKELEVRHFFLIRCSIAISPWSSGTPPAGVYQCQQTAGRPHR